MQPHELTGLICFTAICGLQIFLSMRQRTSRSATLMRQEVEGKSWIAALLLGIGKQDIALVAGPVAEQFALGSNIYFIRSGREPLDHLKGPPIGEALTKGDFSSTAFDTVLGDFIKSCWHEECPSLFAAEEALDHVLADCTFTNGATTMDVSTFNMRVGECRDFIEMDTIFQGECSRLPSLWAQHVGKASSYEDALWLTRVDSTLRRTTFLAISALKWCYSSFKSCRKALFPQPRY